MSERNIYLLFGGVSAMAALLFALVGFVASSAVASGLALALLVFAFQPPPGGRA